MAIRRYNHVELDGKPMKIEIVGAIMAWPLVLPPTSLGWYRNNNCAPIRNARVQGGGGAIGISQGGAHGMRMGRGSDRGGGGNNISAEDLDADLDKYHSEAKETN